MEIQNVKPKLWSRDYILVLISNLVAAGAHSIFLSILPLYVTEIGGNNAVAGAMAGALTAVSMIVRPISGNLIDRIGRRPIVMIGGISFAVVTLMYNIAVNIPLLFMVRMLYGVALGFYLVSAQTLLADVVPQERLVDGVGYYGVSSSLAGSVAPALGVYLSRTFGFRVLFIVMGILGFIGGIVLIGIRSNVKPAPKPNDVANENEKRVKFNPLTLIEISVVVPALVVMVKMFALSASSNYLTTCGLERGIENVAIYFTVNSLVMLGIRLINSKLTKRFTYSSIIMFGIVSMTVSLLLIAWAGSAWMLVVAGVLAGVGNGLALPLIQVIVFKICKPERRGTASATHGLFSDLGNGTGAMVWGMVSNSFGYVITYIAAAICMALSGVVHLSLLSPKLKKLGITKDEN